ncbi:MAG TPA: hypothetical protein VFM36_07485 [Thermoanaerobaculia bacterium]|nr:hypothetical protein [Thermoanaerobaculia bacterium]
MFSIVSRDERWSLGSPDILHDQRLAHGEATLFGSDILATDAVDRELVDLCEREMDAARSAVLGGQARLGARVVATARRTPSSVITESVITFSAGALSVVTSPVHAQADRERLVRIASREIDRSVEPHGVPMIWKNGSASVLLHEAAGHPAEHGQAAIRWPAWLSVRDEPSFNIDDAGRSVEPVDLLRGERPTAMRRSSFADVPLPRLSNIVVRHDGAPFEKPATHLDILLIAGGRYDPLTETVSIFVAAADLVKDGVTRGVRPFVIRESRERIASAIRGARGEPERYPGVICSAEGQEIFVASHAPEILVVF